MSNYLICGNYGALNIGDEAILKGLLYELEKNDAKANLTVISGNPSATKTTHNVNSVDFFPSGIRSLLHVFSLKPTLDAYKKADLFVLGGGGLFTDQESRKAVWIWFIQALIAKLYGKKILIVGQSVGPLDSKTAKYLTKTVFSWADSISVRDVCSKELLENLGIGKEIKISPDLAMNLSEIYSDIIAKEKSVKTEQNPYSVINLKYLKRTNKLYEEEVVKFIKFLISQNQQNVYLKPFGNGEISDEKYLSKLIDQYGLDKNKVRVHTDYSVAGTLKLIANAKFLLGMRLHSLILASVCKTPFIGINYHDKVKNYYAQRERSELAVRNKEQSNHKDSPYILEIDQISCEELTHCHSKLIS